MTDKIMTGEDILEALKKAGEHMTPGQKRRQQVSFIMGTLDSESTITRDYVAAELEKMYGRPSGV